MNGYQFIVAVVASCGGLLFGYEIGMMNVVLVMDTFRIYFGLSNWNNNITNEKRNGISEKYTMNKTYMYRELVRKNSKSYVEGFITSSFIFGAIFGAILSSVLTKRFSSQRMMMMSTTFFTLGSFIQGSSLSSVFLLSLGRMISGFAVGCISIFCPTYIVEVAPIRIRNSINSYYEIMITLGIVIATIINSLIWYKADTRSNDVIQKGKKRNMEDDSIYNKEWRLAFYIQLIPSLLMTILLLFLPNSPRWLCTKLRDNEALEVLAKLNFTSTTDQLVQKELKLLQDDVYTNTVRKSSYKELLDRKHRRRTFISFFTQFFQQWTGIQSILYYQTQFFSGVGFSKVASTITLPIINNSIYFVSTLIGKWKIPKVGCKSLIIIGSILSIVLGMGISISSHQFMDPVNSTLGNFPRYIFIGCIFLFSFICAYAWGPVPKLYQAEISPLCMRVKEITFSTILHFVSSWLVVFFTPILIQYWGMNIFLLFTASCYLALVFSVFNYIESKSSILEKINVKIIVKV